MEADLQTLGVDYRDRYRTGSDGAPLLSLRRIAVLVYRRPIEGGHVEFVRVGAKPFTRTEHIADETRRAVTAMVTHKAPDPWAGRFTRPKEERAQHEQRASTQKSRMARRRRELDRMKEGTNG